MSILIHLPLAPAPLQSLWLSSLALSALAVAGSVAMPWWSQTLQGPVRQLALAFRDLLGTHGPRRPPAAGEMALVRFPSNTVLAHWPVMASPQAWPSCSAP